MNERKKQYFIGGFVNEALDQAIVEGMVEPKTALKTFRRQSERLELGRKLSQDKIGLSSQKIATLYGYPRERAWLIADTLGWDITLPPLVPLTFEEQIQMLPSSQEDRKKALSLLEKDIVDLLVKAQVRIHRSSSRVKTEESIQAKLAISSEERRKNPMMDIFGVRIIIDDFRMVLASNAIHGEYYPPNKFPWGVEADRRIRRKADDGTILYEARHLNISFGGRGLRQIAEIQLMTPEQYEIAQASRQNYEIQSGKRPALES